MIFVTKSYLPDIEEYTTLLKKVWQSGHLTNHGPFVNELEERLRDLLGVPYLGYTNNGTIAIQIAIKALDLKGEVLTTPFSYVATTSSLVWENCKPVFVDIEPETLTIDADKLEAAITPNTTGILATHVYGIPCNVEKIASIAKKHNLKVIYDGAHAFGVKYKGQSLLNFGDATTLSFHATKLFHTVEGGAVVTTNSDTWHKMAYMRNFGHNGPEAFYGVGVNGKSSEFHAAMGVVLLDHLPHIFERRKLLSELYKQLIIAKKIDLRFPTIPEETEYNYAYFPVVFPNEPTLLKVRNYLNATNIFPRRYFYPSLNTVEYTGGGPCPISEDLSCRVLCLPLYPDLLEEQVHLIVSKIAESLS